MRRLEFLQKTQPMKSEYITRNETEQESSIRLECSKRQVKNFVWSSQRVKSATSRTQQVILSSESIDCLRYAYWLHRCKSLCEVTMLPELLCVLQFACSSCLSMNFHVLLLNTGIHSCYILLYGTCSPLWLVLPTIGCGAASPKSQPSSMLYC